MADGAEKATSNVIVGGGAMGALMRAHDWSTSPLGPPEGWPKSLLTIVNLMLNSRQPMFVAWGSALAFLYNDNYSPIFGARHPRALGLPFRQVWSEIWDDISPLIERALAGESTWHENLHLVMERNGFPEDTWYTFSYSPAFGDDGAIGGMFCSCIETTAQVTAETGLAERTLELERITLAAPAAIYINDRRDLRSTYVSAGITAVMGFAPEDICALPPGGLLDLVHPDDRAVVTDMLRRAEALGEGETLQVEYRVRHKDTRWIDVLDRVVVLDRTPDGGVAHTLGVVIDITERRRAEDRLRDSEARLRLVQSAGIVGSFDWDMASGHIHRSPEYLAIHGLPDDSPHDGLYTDKWRERLHPDDRAEVEAWFEADKARVGAFEHEYRIRRESDGAERWIVNRGAVLGDARGEPARLLSAQIDVTERREAVEALRESETRFRLIADSAPVPIWVTKLDRTRGFVNQAYCAFLGRSFDECLTFDWRTVIHPDDAEQLRAASIAGEASLAPFTLEGRYRRGDGEWRWLKSESQPRWDAEGAHSGFIGVAHDITDAKQAEIALRDSEAELRLVTDALPVLVSFVDAGERYRFNNKAYEGWFGHSRAEIHGRTMREVLGDAAYERVAPHVARALAGEQVRFDARLPYRDGGARDVLVEYIPHTVDGRVAGFYVMVQDVSERVAAERRERAAAAEREAILRQLGEGVIVTDSDGRITFANDAAAALHGVDRLDFTPGSYMRTYTVLDETGTPFAAADMPLTRAFRDGVASTGIRWRLERPDGVELVLTGGAQPVMGPGGGLIGAVLTFSDDTARAAAEAALKQLNETLEARVGEEISERLRAEESLRQAQKMEAIGKLTGGIAHDFNNLLTVILSSVDLLKRPTTTDERRARYIDAIGETAQRAAALTSQLLAFARRQPLTSLSFDAGARLAAMRPVLHTMLGQGVRLTVAAEPDQVVKADPNQFESALLNMAVNARDAMPEGGDLNIAVGPDEDPETVAVTVTDTGAGIPEDMLQTIFEPFYTTKGVGKGTGLGLSQVYGFARQSGGRIDVTSEPGKGTVFTLRLPRGELGPEPADAAPAQQGDAAPRRILVVEDNRAVGEFAAQLLTDMGHGVTLEDNAAAALDRVRAGEPFDLVFTDVIMPGSLDGLALARTLRADHPALPVILTTGYAQGLAEDASHGFEILRKPYTADVLQALIAQVTA